LGTPGHGVTQPGGQLLDRLQRRAASLVLIAVSAACHQAALRGGFFFGARAWCPPPVFPRRWFSPLRRARHLRNMSQVTPAAHDGVLLPRSGRPPATCDGVRATNDDS